MEKKVQIQLLAIIHLFNPLSPVIHIQILQTDLHTFPLRISRENLIKHQGIFSFVIIFYILTTLSLDNVWTLLGEKCCWSLLGLKGLTHSSVKKLRGYICMSRRYVVYCCQCRIQTFRYGGGGVSLKIFRPFVPQFGIKLIW